MPVDRWTYDVLGRPTPLVVEGRNLLPGGKPAEGIIFSRLGKFGHILVPGKEGFANVGYTLHPVKSPLRLKVEAVLRRADYFAFGWLETTIKNA